MSDEAPPLFDDIPDADDPFEVSADSSDREILRAIWTRNEVGDLPTDEAWAVLSERYPSESRFLLLNAYEELMQPSGPGVWTPDYFALKAIRILDGSPALKPQVLDLVVTAWSHLKRTAALERLVGRLGTPAAARPPSDDDVDEAHCRLSRFAAAVVKEMHDRTVGGAAIAPKTEDPKVAMKATGPARRYDPGATYEAGAVIEHPKFGVGVVVNAREAGRVEIRFPDGTRKLVCAIS